MTNFTVSPREHAGIPVETAVSTNYYKDCMRYATYYYYKVY